ncbi:MAG: hypothetical protein N2648_02500 [Aquificaceae bacterium]|nr:hypothetical protein [Aquificaceae bacterium]MCS7196739.1 hypothetical protein [Aquificaceae bacterium]MCX7989496.1 hypothetical protein [Aquificaceae bacterium]MDW8032773.1 hypothetical protein [Aquificaceae bacterium]MDW8294921.1 hypothetical protein [Aquificaceae bacterium]
MGDFTKAGLDRGDLEKELEHTLLSAKMLYKTYSATLEDLRKEELLHDLREYEDQLRRFILPLVKRAEETGDKRLVNTAYEIRYTYEKLLELIRQGLDNS